MGHDDAHLLDLLDLDGEVLRGYWAAAIGWLRQQADGAPRRRLLDLGAGTGTGTIALAERFAGAEVVAVDAVAPALERVRAKALNHGLAPRVQTVEADLDGAWPEVGPVDITWASMSLHHLADPDRVLRRLAAATRPGGLLAVAEFAEQLRFLPGDLAGLEERCLSLVRRRHRQSLPHLGADWSARLREAGWPPVADREFAIDLRPGSSAAAVRYARLWLTRLAEDAGEHLAAADRDALRAFDRWDELHLRGTRTVTLARRS